MPFSFVCDENTLTPAVNEDGSFQLDNKNDNVATWKVRIDLNVFTVFDSSANLLETRRTSSKG